MQSYKKKKKMNKKKVHPISVEHNFESPEWLTELYPNAFTQNVILIN